MPLLAIALSGCRNRAYNELYIEGMAAEIRDLEDQLYEYDDLTRQLEQELASLRAENARLMTTPPVEPRAKPGLGLERSPRPTPAPVDSLPSRTSGDDMPARDEPLPLDPAPSSGRPRSILDAPNDTQPNSVPVRPNDEALPPPFRNTLPDPPATTLPEEVPSREELPSLDFDPDELAPPAIEPGEPMPPPGGFGSIDFTSKDLGNLELEQSRISLPAQLAGHQSASAALPVDRSAEQTLSDRRVVELAFSPLHCRSVNMDDDPADDGLVLLIQPMNTAGQVVPVAADLSVVILDPAREGSQARIGRWDYSATDVKNKLKPLGAHQGIELTLPWKGPGPTADRVIVFARYTFQNGRQVIGQKEILVSTAEGLQAAWFPRGAAQSTAVQPASATR